MKQKLISSLALGAIVLGATVARAATVLPLDPHHTSATFTVQHLMITKVSGQIPLIKSKLSIDEANIPTAITASLDAGKIETQDENRDKDLCSDKWFDTAKYPTIEFRSTKIIPGADKAFTVDGNLTIHGVTKPVVLTASYEGTATDPYGHTHLGYTATGVIKRSAFGVGNAPAAIVGDDINITLEVEALKN